MAKSKSLFQAPFSERRCVKFAVMLVPYKNEREKGGKSRMKETATCSTFVTLSDLFVSILRIIISEVILCADFLQDLHLQSL